MIRKGIVLATWSKSQSEIRISLYKLKQSAEREGTQTIICIIGHVGHVNIDRIVQDCLEQFAPIDASE